MLKNVELSGWWIDDSEYDLNGYLFTLFSYNYLRFLL